MKTSPPKSSNGMAAKMRTNSIPRKVTESRVFTECSLFRQKSLSSVHSVVSDSLWPQGLQHARLPCPSPTLGDFLMSPFFASGGQSIGISASSSVLPMNIKDWFPSGWTGWTLKSLLQHNSLKASILWHSAFFMVQLSHLYMTTGKTIALTRWAFVGQVMSLLFNMLSRLVIIFFLGASIF